MWLNALPTGLTPPAPPPLPQTGDGTVIVCRYEPAVLLSLLLQCHIDRTSPDISASRSSSEALQHHVPNAITMGADTEPSSTCVSGAEKFPDQKKSSVLHSAPQYTPRSAQDEPIPSLKDFQQNGVTPGPVDTEPEASRRMELCNAPKIPNPSLPRSLPAPTDELLHHESDDDIVNYKPTTPPDSPRQHLEEPLTLANPLAHPNPDPDLTPFSSDGNRSGPRFIEAARPVTPLAIGSCDASGNSKPPLSRAPPPESRESQDTVVDYEHSTTLPSHPPDPSSPSAQKNKPITIQGSPAVMHDVRFEHGLVDATETLVQQHTIGLVNAHELGPHRSSLLSQDQESTDDVVDYEPSTPPDSPRQSLNYAKPMHSSSSANRCPSSSGTMHNDSSGLVSVEGARKPTSQSLAQSDQSSASQNLSQHVSGNVGDRLAEIGTILPVDLCPEELGTVSA